MPRRPWGGGEAAQCAYCTLKMDCKRHREGEPPSSRRSRAKQATLDKLYTDLIQSRLDRIGAGGADGAERGPADGAKSYWQRRLDKQRQLGEAAEMASLGGGSQVGMRQRPEPKATRRPRSGAEEAKPSDASASSSSSSSDEGGRRQRRKAEGRRRKGRRRGSSSSSSSDEETRRRRRKRRRRRRRSPSSSSSSSSSEGEDGDRRRKSSRATATEGRRREVPRSERRAGRSRSPQRVEAARHHGGSDRRGAEERQDQ